MELNELESVARYEEFDSIKRLDTGWSGEEK